MANMSDPNQIETTIKSFGPTLREMYYRVEENVLITLIISFTKLREAATADLKPGLILTVDELLKLLETHRDSK